ncbi:NUMOD4 motif-containing HNH endonuclease [Tetragenococcus koreensis]|uniref:NUMOD4 domain-containing protein n=1 Tax=Tetragenococcus koreensis TaxID=290335 RepID=UPI001F433940|nr:NUMOD4 domain-containing protein [Tetragenococcus koreensis]MCF1614809.1 NUMOD4 motif-containing HNH endonuclease [Tetragenococcus koreensis]MCF1624627.1 NUMOD4 motif-containing HNH endonuclease [Tetragenococcus koreensis]
MEEKWRNILGFEGYYQVSNFGRVKSLDRVDCRGHNLKSMVLKQRYDKDGYKLVYLSKQSKGQSYLVHRLVAIAFIKNIDNKPQVNHINENKFDNNVNNLEWCTSKENVNHGTGIERRKRTKSVIAVNIKTGKKLEFSSCKAAAEFGFNQSQISNCCNRIEGYYTHFGYKFRWKELY